MLTQRSRHARWPLACLLIVTQVCPATLLAEGFRLPWDKGTSIEQLARKIDKLEHHIDQHGSIVAKTPDVWGESRLMQHRAEYERQMAQNLDGFKPSFQAAVNRSDQAYLSSAFALQAAIVSGRRGGTAAAGSPAAASPALSAPTQAKVEQQSYEVFGQNTLSRLQIGKNGEFRLSEPAPATAAATGAGTASSGSDSNSTSSSTGSGSGSGSGSTGVQIPTIGFNVFEKGAVPSDAIKRSSLSSITQPGFGANGLQLEPQVLLEQESRYLNYLNQLRRINEGDDNADAPGYALDLVRIPVSVLPGTRTREGYGAEITVSVNNEIGDEVLPATFRGWVTNDLITQLAVPLTKGLNDPTVDAVIPVLLAEASRRRTASIPWHERKTFCWNETLKESEVRARADDLKRVLFPTPNGTAESTTTGACQAADLQKIIEASPIPKLAFAQLLNGREDLVKDLVKKISPEAFKSMMGDEIQRSLGSNCPEGRAAEGVANLIFLRMQLDSISEPEERELVLRAIARELLILAPSPRRPLRQFGVFGSEEQLNCLMTSGCFGTTLPAEQTLAIRRLLADYPLSIDEFLARLTSRLLTYASANHAIDQLQATANRLGCGRAGKITAFLALANSVPEHARTRDESTFSFLKTFGSQSFGQVFSTDSGVTRSRQVQYAFPVSQFSWVYGDGLLLHAGTDIWLRLKSDRESHVHFHEVEAFLKEEVGAAFEMLCEIPELYAYCSPELVRAIRTRDWTAIEHIQTQFFQLIPEDGKNTLTAAFAWAVVCNAALLNQRLIQDMEETAANRGCPCLLQTAWLDYYSPSPSPEARLNFRQYVNCRWPIHVFAIDPITSDQNVMDSFGLRREMQLAVALAFAAGRVNAQSMTNFVRRIEQEIQTIELNRTAVGFTHGDNTVGWRFTPRVQTPPIQSNAAVIVNDLIIGGPRRDQQIKHQLLEAGPRECVAMVVRPAFIPQLTFDVRSNWFKLTKPGRTKTSLADTVALSQDIKELEMLSQMCIRDEHLYRDGEVYRLMKRVKQLEQELPLQTLRSNVPDDTTEGGFAIFNAGNSGLAPQLYSWYGQPGIDVDAENTVFLVGENFAVQGTRVIAGNQTRSPLASVRDKGVNTELVSAEALGRDAQVELLSQRVLRLTISAGTKTVKKPCPECPKCFEEFVQVHVATPNGVSQVLEIPAYRSSDAAAKAVDDAIKTAITKHRDADHLDRFAWAAPDPGLVLNVTRNAAGDVQDVQIAQQNRGQELQLKSSSPIEATRESFGDAKIQLRGAVVVLNEDRSKSQNLPERLELELPVAGSKIPVDALQPKLKTILEPMLSRFPAKHMEIQFYARQPNAADTPTIKVDNLLTATVNLVELPPKPPENPKPPASDKAAKGKSADKASKQPPAAPVKPAPAPQPVEEPSATGPTLGSDQPVDPLEPPTDDVTMPADSIEGDAPAEEPEEVPPSPDHPEVRRAPIAPIRPARFETPDRQSVAPPPSRPTGRKVRSPRPIDGLPLLPAGQVSR